MSIAEDRPNSLTIYAVNPRPDRGGKLPAPSLTEAQRNTMRMLTHGQSCLLLAHGQGHPHKVDMDFATYHKRLKTGDNTSAVIAALDPHLPPELVSVLFRRLVMEPFFTCHDIRGYPSRYITARHIKRALFELHWSRITHDQCIEFQVRGRSAWLAFDDVYHAFADAVKNGGHRNSDQVRVEEFCLRNDVLYIRYSTDGRKDDAAIERELRRCEAGRNPGGVEQPPEDNAVHNPVVPVSGEQDFRHSCGEEAVRAHT